VSLEAGKRPHRDEKGKQQPALSTENCFTIKKSSAVESPLQNHAPAQRFPSHSQPGLDCPMFWANVSVSVAQLLKGHCGGVAAQTIGFSLSHARTPFLDGRLRKILCVLRKQRRGFVEQSLLEKSQNVGVKNMGYAFWRDRAGAR
jgi:hypothetical protein